ncbi:MAG: substrate-binding domain-containing protein [Clostridia bacterium]
MDDSIVMDLPRASQEKYLIQDEMLQGRYGAPGAPFMTTRELAAQRGVSLVTAQHIMVKLRDDGFIELRGKKYFLSYGEQAKKFDDRSKIIGLLITNLQNEYQGMIAKAIKTLAEREGYRILVMDTAYSREEERKAMELMVDLGVAGILSCPAPTPEDGTLYRDCPVPCVLLTHSIKGTKRSSVLVNSFPMAQRIAKHLVEQGYRKFFYLGTQTLRLLEDERCVGFRTGLQREGFALDAADVIQIPQNYKEAAPTLTEMLSRQTEPVGVFCYHDLIAAELYRVCYGIGKKIPDDVGIVGFDDLPVATSIYPSLTTVQYRIMSMAEIALQQLLKEVQTGHHKYDTYYVEPNLIARESTALKNVR